MGLLMGVSGVALAAYVGSGTTGAGQGYELDVIASCILGGTSTLGGEGTVFGGDRRRAHHAVARPTACR